MALSRFLASMSASAGGNLPTVTDTFRPSGCNFTAATALSTTKETPLEELGVRIDRRE
jgi:hypothetical protein